MDLLIGVCPGHKRSSTGSYPRARRPRSTFPQCYSYGLTQDFVVVLGHIPT